MGGRNTIYLGNVGLVLFFHGNAGDRRNRVSICQILTDQKAGVFLFDYRRYGNDPGSPTEEGLAADARAVWKYATEQRKVPPNGLCFTGPRWEAVWPPG